MSQSVLDKRSKRLLQLLIERYIRDGQPVGSKILAQDFDNSISSATIRNIMAELEEAGYIQSPHTSSGRIPTDEGYRLFVDHLLVSGSFVDIDAGKLKEALSVKQDEKTLLHSASALLSDFTHLAGLVTIPQRNQIILRHIEFLPLSDLRVLVILVFHKHEVQNRIIYTDRQYSKNELQQAANFLNEHYSGQDLLQVREDLLKSLKNDQKQANQMMQAAIEMADQALKSPITEKDCILAGQTNLLGFVDISGIERLQSIFEAFSQKQGILHLLDQCLNSDGIQIFIGKKSGYEWLDEFSLIIAPYSANNEIVGVLGVIGPTRMPYQQAISTVDMTARILTAIMDEY